MKLLYNTQTEQVLPWPRIDEEPIVGLAPELLEMTVVESEPPAYNSETQVLTQSDSVNVEAQTVTRTWAVTDLIYTAEQIVSQYFSAYQIAALQRFEMALLQAGKPLGVKMTAAKNWLEAVMLGWAMNPVAAPAASFGIPAASFEEASAEAVADLSTPNPET
jgi:hypothetical protein